MTVFYVLLYYVWRQHYRVQKQNGLTVVVYLLAGLRVVLCMMPQNQWFSAAAPLSWGIYRNIPFALLGLPDDRAVLPQRQSPAMTARSAGCG